uniref:Uncharacterized protein n=1 Tax=Trichogramma kaykai TaxID=54128 RepID=A0ABD2XIK9_9HYME
MYIISVHVQSSAHTQEPGAAAAAAHQAAAFPWKNGPILTWPCGVLQIARVARLPQYKFETAAAAAAADDDEKKEQRNIADQLAFRSLSKGRYISSVMDRGGYVPARARGSARAIIAVKCSEPRERLRHRRGCELPTYII